MRANDIGQKARLIVWGGTGQLGCAVCSLAARQGVTVVATVSRRKSRQINSPTDVLIDASAPDALDQVIDYCRSTRTALVECVSNLSGNQLQSLQDVSSNVPVLIAENLSFGHFLQERLVRQLAGLINASGQSFDTAIVERHPTTKAHRPSATAQRLANVWASELGCDVQDVASIRAGNPVSDHALVLTLPGASLTVEHKVTDLAAAASGALYAAHWLLSQPPGLYGMEEVYADWRAPADKQAITRVS